MTLDRIQLFHARRQMFDADIREVESTLGMDILLREGSNATSDDKDDVYYPQLEEALRKEASEMAEHYEVFYALERSIRQLVGEQLREDQGSDWWDSAVPDSVKQNVNKNVEKERDQGVTPRSTELIDYTTFGELGEIIRSNWSSFGGIFNNRKALDKIFVNLNTLRAPIAHCAPLAPDEVLRLRLAVRDWFRLME